MSERHRTHADLFVGLRGVLRLSRPIVDDIDGFSLLVMRSMQMGTASFSAEGQSLSTAQWSHADAGNDWTQGGQERDLLWHHVVVPADDVPTPVRSPIQAVVEGLEASLWRIGEPRITSIVASIPLRMTQPSWAEIAASRPWFSLGSQPSDLDLAVAINEGGDPSEILGGLCGRLKEVLGEVLDIRSTPGGRTRVSAPWDEREDDRSESRVAFALQVDAPEWSPSLAAWLLEGVASAGRELELGDDLVVEVGPRSR